MSQLLAADSAERDQPAAGGPVPGRAASEAGAPAMLATRIRVMMRGRQIAGGPSSSPKLGAATDLPEGAEGIVIGLYGTTVVAVEIDVARFGACRHPRGRTAPRGQRRQCRKKVAYGN